MPPTRPNILLITTDQQHWNTVEVGNPRIKTPNLDRTAMDGVLFQRVFCLPRLFPGPGQQIDRALSPWHHGWTIGVKLPEDVPTMSAILDANASSTW